jgi:hypothetical protein
MDTNQSVCRPRPPAPLGEARANAATNPHKIFDFLTFWTINPHKIFDFLTFWTGISTFEAFGLEFLHPAAG